jgi:hypothetical protein
MCIGYIYSSKCEAIEGEPAKLSMLDKIVGKEVYLKYKVAGTETKPEYLYMAIGKREDCNNIKKDEVYECFYNVALLQKEKNDYTKFVISKVKDKDRYTLQTKIDGILPKNAKLSQNINYLDLREYVNKDAPVNTKSKAFLLRASHEQTKFVQEVPVCFDDGEDSVVDIEIKEQNGKIKIVFHKERDKQTTPYYVGICPSICVVDKNNKKRLCLFKKEEQGILFNIEIDK